MKATKVYLALGSNIGEREKNLRRAIAALAGAGVRVTRASSIYETEPVDYLEQAWFLNCVVEAETELRPVELLRALRGIESAMGSKKEFAKGPRLIDLDILFYGDEIVDEKELQVPHPRMAQRRFVLAPLAEIASGVKDPRTGKTVAHMFEESGDRSEVKKISSTATGELGIH